jgi:hypothetical protein
LLRIDPSRLFSRPLRNPSVCHHGIEEQASFDPRHPKPVGNVFLAYWPDTRLKSDCRLDLSDAPYLSPHGQVALASFRQQPPRIGL